MVGEPVQAGDVTIIPLIDVTCGMGAGAFFGRDEAETERRRRYERQDEPQRGAGDPERRDPTGKCEKSGRHTKVIDMAPDFINKFLGGKPPVSEETAQAAQDAAAAYDGDGRAHRCEIVRQIRAA